MITTKQTTIRQLKKEYEKICLKLEQLNEDAFNLEKEIIIRQHKEGVF